MPKEGLQGLFVYLYNPAMKKRRRGAPPKPASERASKQVHFRCTAAEKRSYKEKATAADKGLSAWLKDLADKG